MKRFAFVLMTLCIIFSALPASGQGRQGMMGGGAMGSGYGMGPGMMGSPIWLTVPEKLLPPKNAEWVAKLRELLTLEEKAFDQYAVDQDKYNTAMPYMMVMSQEEDHVETLQRLFQAYGLMPGRQVSGACSGHEEPQGVL